MLTCWELFSDLKLDCKWILSFITSSGVFLKSNANLSLSIYPWQDKNSRNPSLGSLSHNLNPVVILNCRIYHRFKLKQIFYTIQGHYLRDVKSATGNHKLEKCWFASMLNQVCRFYTLNFSLTTEQTRMVFLRSFRCTFYDQMLYLTARDRLLHITYSHFVYFFACFLGS